MIRLSKPSDTSAVIAIAEAIGFQSSELEVINTLLADYFGNVDDNDLPPNSKTGRFWLTDEDTDGIIGVAYCEPERMTDQTWNLQLIAIHPNYQGRGRGSTLLRHVEDALKERGGRMLLVETLASFELAQAFYKKWGYQEEARIRDFYAAGDDKVVFRKVLS